MKKLLHALLFIMLLPCILLAQSSRFKGLTPYPVMSNSVNKAVPAPKSITGSEIRAVNNGAAPQRNAGSYPNTASQQVIGTTTYDLQTNATSCSRIYRNGGIMGATWTMSQQLVQNYPDRGAGVNFFDGTAWGAPPSTWLDTISWPNIDLGAGNTEYLLGYNRYQMANDLFLLKRTPAGTGTWVKSYLPPHPDGAICLWSRMRVGGTNGQSIHVIAMPRPVANGGTLPSNGVDGSLTYSRSQDGGATWDIIHADLPMMDVAHYNRVSADTYTLDVRGNTVAIVQGSFYNDWVLWKSTDNGTTWTRTVIFEFPIAAYNLDSMITDVNTDGVADTIDFIDGSLAVLIDNNDMVHTWAGRMRVYQDAPSFLTYIKGTDGLLYWKEQFAGIPPVMIAITPDIDQSGSIEVPDGISSYAISMTSMPTAGMVGGQNLVVTYSGIIENTTNGNPDPLLEEAFRNIFCIISTDNGNSWSLPVRIEPDDFFEFVYPSIAYDSDSLLHIVCQVDPEPGSALTGGDSVGFNDIVYLSEDPQIVFNGVPVIPYYYSWITGNVYFDDNQNGINDGGDYNLPGFPILMMPDNEITPTNNNGNFMIASDNGTKIISPVTSGNWSVTSDSASYTVEADTIIIEDLDFGLYPANLIYDVNTVLTEGFPRCNNAVSYWITYKNVGTLATSGTVRLVKDNQMGFGTSAPPYTNAVADTFEWAFTNLLPYESRQIFLTLSSAGLNVGDTVLNCATTFYDNGSTGGVSEECVTQAIACAFDPNDKQVDPEGVGLPHYSLLNDTLIYTIRFQNTGNDTAFTVRIRDTLDAFLDISTFRLIASSHQVDLTTYPGGILVFTFPDILLPDSNVNLAGSNGFVKYSIQPLPALPVGTPVYNTAHIFFDYNPGVMTNTTMNTLVDVIGFAEVQSSFGMYLYPNPASYKSTLHFATPLLQPHTVSISDITGRTILQLKNITGQDIEINSLQFNRGMYLCKLYNAVGVMIAAEKLIIR